MTGKLYSTIEKEKQSRQDISVNGILKKLELSKSGYYDFIDRKPSENSQKRDKVMDMIFEIYYKSNQTYGVPKIHHEIQKMGIFVSERTVTNYMQILDIKACWVKKVKFVSPKPDTTCELKNEYIDTFYNTTRIHSACGYLSPDEYECQYYQSAS